jgi:GT2 family glycosyltransferase
MGGVDGFAANTTQKLGYGAQPRDIHAHKAAMNPLVVILTLNWNRQADTLAFLASCAALRYAHVQTIVVDNGSSDGSPAAIAAQFPQVIQLRNTQNLGFAAGMNVGLRYAMHLGAAYVFLANNDTLLASDALDLLVATAETHQAALVAPAIYYADAPSELWWLGGMLRPLLLEVHKFTQVPSRQPFRADFVTGCGVLISRATLEQVGLFDERFFMYYEDSDYCLRVQRAGGRTLVDPRAVMYHKVAQSSGGSDSPNERYQMGRSSVQYFRKHARLWQWPLIGLYRTGSAVRTLWRLVRRRRLNAATAYLRGLRDGLLAQ